MMIDIDRLSEPELIDLNQRIVERLRFLSQMRAHRDMLEFRIGDRVGFQTDRSHIIHGIITRYNKKTVTVIADDGRRWNVSPGLLHAAPVAGEHAGSKNVTPGRILASTDPARA
ncbi:MAG: hypothetical protein WA668_16885 [Candidatus Cybelea sp.]